jgi:uncharacterized membrane protein
MVLVGAGGQRDASRHRLRGLVVMLVPFFAWWLDVSLWQAFVLDLGLLLFFLGYTFVFNWAFDRVFGLPASALPVGGLFEIIIPKI